MAGDKTPRSHWPQQRFILATDGLGQWTASVETATAGRVGGTGHIALEKHEFMPLIRMGGKLDGRDRAQKGLGIGVQRIIENRIARSQFDQLAQIHDADAVADMLHDA